jgi:hypothetical protein
MALIQLRRPRKITERKEKTGENASGHNPNAFDDRMPEPADVKPL